MKIIPREARRVTYSAEIRARKQALHLNERQRAVTLGTVLGDGALIHNWSQTNRRLRIQHSAKQETYLLWKYGVLKEWVLSAPKFWKRTNSWSFTTISHPELTNIAVQFYQDGHKIVPREIDRILENPLTFAVWFMDDGNAIKRNGKIYGFHLNTQSFSLDENRLLRTALKRIYGIEAAIERNHGKHRLRIMRKASRERFIAAIQHFVMSSMQYKLG